MIGGAGSSPRTIARSVSIPVRLPTSPALANGSDQEYVRERAVSIGPQATASQSQTQLLPTLLSLSADVGCHMEAVARQSARSAALVGRELHRRARDGDPGREVDRPRAARGLHGDPAVRRSAGADGYSAPGVDQPTGLPSSSTVCSGGSPIGSRAPASGTSTGSPTRASTSTRCWPRSSPGATSYLGDPDGSPPRADPPRPW